MNSEYQTPHPDPHVRREISLKVVKFCEKSQIFKL